MKKYALLFLFSTNIIGGNAVLANNPTIWNQGEMTLVNGTKLSGDVSYNWKAEVVQVRQDNTVKAYSAFQVQAFKYYDNLQNVVRSFSSVEFPVKHTLLRQVFLEEFVSGPLVVYRRLRHVHEPIKAERPADFGSDEELTKNLDFFAYYVFDGSSFTDLDRFNREIWPKLEQEYETELRQYMRNRSISLSDTLGRILIINQYNALKSQSGEFGSLDLTAPAADQ